MKRKIIAALLCGALCLGTCTSSLADVDYSKKDVVKQVQTALNNAGYDCGTPDGISGSGTQGAIQRFRTDHQLADSTAIDDELIEALKDEGGVFFFPAELSELKLVPSPAFSQAREALREVGAYTGGDFSAEIGNLTTMGSMIIADLKYTVSDDMHLLANVMYVPNEDPEWSVNYVQGLEDGNYYYLSPDREGTEDVVDFHGADGASGSEATESKETIHVDFHSSVRNDVTGKWRLAIVDTSAPVNSYVVSYYKNFFKSDDEIHGIINKHDGTTSCVSVMLGMFSITVHKYVAGEENDANLLFSGDVISDEFYSMETGEIVDF